MRVPHSRREDCQLDHSVLSSWLPRSSEATKKSESISMLVIVLVSINRSVMSDSLQLHGLSIGFFRQEY